MTFREEWANWSGFRTICLTFDVDWAPEYMIAEVLERLERHGARATFFATHRSERLLAEAERGVHEVGLHPNLLPTSTQSGAGARGVAARLRQTYPRARGCRFHVLAHSYRDLAEIDLVYDVSALRFNCPYLLPAWHRDLNMTLLTYSWEDGVCENAGLPLTLGSVELDEPGMKILNFHPLNVWVNGPDSTARLALLSKVGSLLDCPREVAESHRHHGAGAGDVLERLLEVISRRKIRTAVLSGLVDAFHR